jgi:succinylglutamate desuccinylase
MKPEQLQQFADMKKEITELLSKVESMKQEIDSLKSNTSISPDVETAFVERLKIIDFTPLVKGTGTTTASTQNKSLSGDPETITVPAQPSGALVVTYNGTTYNLLYK